jgi:hypothetical protein
MPSLASRCRAFALALAVPFLFAKGAAAQGQGDKDLKAISAYTLTMPRYRQFMNAMLNVGKAAQKDSTIGAAFEGSGNLGLDQLVARYNSVPAVKSAITGAGMSPREFALAQGAFLQAGMSYGLMKQLKLSPDSVVKTTGVSRANLEFFSANEAEITRLNKDLEAQMPRDASASPEQPDVAAEAEPGDSTE